MGGASRGIGLEIARSFRREGAEIVLLARGEETLQAALEGLGAEGAEPRAAGHAVDLRDATATQEALRRVERVDCLVANAGSGAGEPGWEASPEEWQRLLGENLVTATNLCRAAIPQMSAGGSIVLVASIAGMRRLPAPMPYSAAKAALIRYGKDLAHELAPREIRVNIVAPGNVRFPGGRWDELHAEDPVAVDSYISQRVPLGRFGSPQEIADAVLFLSSPRSSFTTGSCLAIDGGQLHD